MTTRKAEALVVRENEVVQRLAAERAQLAALALALRPPVRRADLLGQGVLNLGARWQRLRRWPGAALGLVPAALLFWRLRGAVRTGVRVWTVVRILQGWRDRGRPARPWGDRGRPGATGRRGGTWDGGLAGWVARALLRRLFR